MDDFTTSDDGVVLADPAIPKEEVPEALEAFVGEVKARCDELGLKWDEAAEAYAAHRFFASERYLGPLTAEVWAGWAFRNLKIQTKDGRLIPFRVNPMQFRLLVEVFKDYCAGKPVRFIILKARQFGFSTLIEGLAFFFTSTLENYNSTIIAHKSDASTNLYQMTQRYLTHCGKRRPLTNKNNARRLEFAQPLDSKLSVESAESRTAGRSLTNRFLHCSESAFWPYVETRTGLMQTVADVHGSFIFEESTANGVGNQFYENYFSAKRGQGLFRAIFFPWHENPLYTADCDDSMQRAIMQSLTDEERRGIELHSWTAGQLLWRRITIADKCDGDVGLFHQEYPSTDREAFLTSGTPVFDQALLQKRVEAIEGSQPLFEGRLVYTGEAT